MIEPLLEHSVVFLIKLPKLLLHYPAITHLGSHQKELKTYAYTKTGVLMATPFIIARKWKQSNVHQLMNGKQNVVYLYNKILFSA